MRDCQTDATRRNCGLQSVVRVTPSNVSVVGVVGSGGVCRFVFGLLGAGLSDRRSAPDREFSRSTSSANRGFSSAGGITVVIGGGGVFFFISAVCVRNCQTDEVGAIAGFRR